MHKHFSADKQSTGETVQIATFLGLVGLALATRWLPHPANLTAVGAVALFSGAFFRRWWMAPLAPLASLLLSDLVFSVASSGSDYQQWHFLSPIHYVLFALTALLGRLMHERRGLGRILATTLAATVLYYLISNFSEWCRPESGVPLYPATMTGLMECYVAGLPFARNMLAGNLIYAALLFGGWNVMQELTGRRELAPAKVRL
jgi:hypothetical protein